MDTIFRVDAGTGRAMNEWIPWAATREGFNDGHCIEFKLDGGLGPGPNDPQHVGTYPSEPTILWIWQMAADDGDLVRLAGEFVQYPEGFQIKGLSLAGGDRVLICSTYGYESPYLDELG
jgi:hypothetical protein